MIKALLLFAVLLRPFIHGGKDQHKSCTAHHGEPLLCPCLRTTCNFFGYFSGLGNVASPSSNEHGYFCIRIVLVIFGLFLTTLKISFINFLLFGNFFGFGLENFLSVLEFYHDGLNHLTYKLFRF